MASEWNAPGWDPKSGSFAGGSYPTSSAAPSYQTNYPQQPSGNPFDHRDVYDMTQGLGGNAYAQGQNLQNQAAGQSDYYSQQMGGYGNLAKNLFNPIWNGGGGYNAEQMANVLGDRTGLQNQVAGQNQSLLDLANNGAAAGNQIAQNAAGGVRAAQNAGQVAYGQTGQGLASALSGAQGAYGQTGQNLANALGATSQGLNRAMATPGLQVTPEYLRQAGMSDDQVRATANQAAQQIGGQYRAAKDQVTQSAMASGQGTPGQLAAALGALQNQEGAQESEALTGAQLAAQAQQRQAAQGIQNTQLQAGQFQAGLGSQNALGLGGLASQNALNYGNQGLALGGLASQNALGYGAQGLQREALGGQLALGVGQQQLGASQFGTGAQMSAAQQNIGNAMGLQGQLSNQYQQAYAPWMQAQQAGWGAALGLGQQAQAGANQAFSNQLNAYNSANANQLGAANAYSQYGNSPQGEGFGGILANSFANSLGNGFGIGQGVGSGLGSQLGKNLLHAAEGGLVSSPQLIQVGENSRPEAILPLSPNKPAGQQNMWEKMGSQLGNALGIQPQQGQPQQPMGAMPNYSPATTPHAFARGGIIGGHLMKRPHGYRMNMHPNLARHLLNAEIGPDEEDLNPRMQRMLGLPSIG